MRDNTRGIAIVANDKITKWLLAFLESWQATNAATPLYIIPYDENCAATRHAAKVYGATMVDAELKEIDALAKRLYPLTPGRRRRLRKLQSLALPLDQVIYLDADIILFRDFSPLFGKLEKGRREFIIASTSPDYVYNEAGQEHQLFQGATLFNDGFFSTSSSLLSVGDFVRAIDENEKLFHAVRKRGGLFAQPLVNFVVHSKGLAVSSLAATLPNASDESFYKPVSAHFGADGLPLDGANREIYFSHWAGATGMPRGGIFDKAWQFHYDNAREADEIVSFLTLLSLAAAVWWGLAVLLLVASVIAALLFPHLPWQGPGTEPLRPVTVIVPVKYWNDHFESDQETLFAQDYPELEIVITTARADPKALAAVAAVERKFPALDAHVVNSDTIHAASPKLNSMWPGIEAAWHDLVLIKDSNIRLAPGDVENLVHHHGPGVGLVSTITIATNPKDLGAWIETSIVNCYHARMLMLASALGLGAGCGKIMLFSRAALNKAGGLDALAWAVGEDEAMQQAFAKIGLRTVLSERTSRQLLGHRSFTEIWRRQVRWMLIWRLQTPAVFVGDFLASALPVSFAGAIAAHLVGMGAPLAMAWTLALWFVLESITCLCKGWPISLWSPLAFLGREVLNLAVRIRALGPRQIIWGDGHIRVNPKVVP